MPAGMWSQIVGSSGNAIQDYAYNDFGLGRDENRADANSIHCRKERLGAEVGSCYLASALPRKRGRCMGQFFRRAGYDQLIRSGHY